MATAEMFQLFPGLILHGDFEEDNTKHTVFTEREDMVSGKTLAMNLRRLPLWALSRAQHVSRWGVWPDYRPIPMQSPEELANSDFPDDRLALYTDGGRFEIERWIRMERLAEDFLDFVTDYTDVTEEQRRAVLSLPMVNAHDYDHDLVSWFTSEQIDRMYERNPTWAGLERELYGELVQLQVQAGGGG